MHKKLKKKEMFVLVLTYMYMKNSKLKEKPQAVYRKHPALRNTKFLRFVFFYFFLILVFLGLSDPHPDPLVTQVQIRIRILLSTSKNSKKNFDFFCFVTSLSLFTSVPHPDPDPYVFGHPGFGSFSQMYGSEDPDPHPDQ